MKSRLFVIFGLLILLAPGLALAQTKGDAKAGKTKYDANCVGCHGATGKGDGAAAAALNPKPQDHTNGKVMKALSDKYLFDIIKDGGASQKKLRSCRRPARNSPTRKFGTSLLTFEVLPNKPVK